MSRGDLPRRNISTPCRRADEGKIRSASARKAGRRRCGGRWRVSCADPGAGVAQRLARRRRKGRGAETRCGATDTERAPGAAARSDAALARARSVTSTPGCALRRSVCAAPRKPASPPPALIGTRPQGGGGGRTQSPRQRCAGAPRAAQSATAPRRPPPPNGACAGDGRFARALRRRLSRLRRQVSRLRRQVSRTARPDRRISR